MVNQLRSDVSPSLDFSELFQFALKWTPRAIVAGLAGYYCLGFAYEIGLMARIDALAIRILRSSLGYVGVGAFMPTFQWYSAWGVRIVAALGAGLLYDLSEKVVRAVYSELTSSETIEITERKVVRN
jgi:hypothetical protein